MKCEKTFNEACFHHLSFVLLLLVFTPTLCSKRCVLKIDWALKTSFSTYREREPEGGAMSATDVHMCLDGVILVRAPAGYVARENFCKAEVTHCYRKKSEGSLPELQGYDAYTKQAPLNRCLPLWGGVGPGGFAPVLWHNERKTDTSEWVMTIKKGDLIKALRSVNPGKTYGPWKILCDGETFLHAKESKAMYLRKNIRMWQIPPRSPDLNPVEKFWAWVRKQLVAHDAKHLPINVTVGC